MLTLQLNNEIRINKGDTGMAPLFINIGDSLRPIGYQFNKPVTPVINPQEYYILQTAPLEKEGVLATVGQHETDEETLYLVNADAPNTVRMKCTFYEDAWRNKIIEPGNYHFEYNEGSWKLNGEEIQDIGLYGFKFPDDAIIVEPTTIDIKYELLDNDSTIYFEMWPILQNPELPLLRKIIYPKDNLMIVEVRRKNSYGGTTMEELYHEYFNAVDSLGRIRLQFNREDTEDLERGKYLYQLRALLYNAYNNVTIINDKGEVKNGAYQYKTIINRTPFWIIDDNFSQRIW